MSEDSPQKAKTTNTHRTKHEHIPRDGRKATRAQRFQADPHSFVFVLGTFWILGFLFLVGLSRGIFSNFFAYGLLYIGFLDCLEKSACFGFPICIFWDCLEEWPLDKLRSLVCLLLFGLSRRICSCFGLCVLVLFVSFLDCFEEYAHFLACGLWLFFCGTVSRDVLILAWHCTSSEGMHLYLSRSIDARRNQISCTTVCVQRKSKSLVACRT